MTLAIGSTTAGEVLRADGRRLQVVGTLAVAAVVGTNAVFALFRPSMPQWITSSQTSSMPLYSVPAEHRGLPDARSALREIRTRTTMTWEQIAGLLGVERRTLHLWASGRRISTRNEDGLSRLLTFVRDSDRGDLDGTTAFVLENFLPPWPVISEATVSNRKRGSRLSREQRIARRGLMLKDFADRS